jgi:rubrerythrin
MRTIRIYPDPIIAEAAAAMLWESGIDARIISRANATLVGSSAYGEYELMVAENTDAGRARELLDAFRPDLSGPTTSELAAAVRADLSQLPAAFNPSCPSCCAAITPFPRPERCPSCAARIDIEQLIVDQHGPEAMEFCYQVEPGEISDDLLATARLDCPGCAYPLTSLPARGQCPECGLPYDKQSMLTRRAGPF